METREPTKLIAESRKKNTHLVFQNEAKNIPMQAKCYGYEYILQIWEVYL